LSNHAKTTPPPFAFVPSSESLDSRSEQKMPLNEMVWRIPHGFGVPMELESVISATFYPALISPAKRSKLHHLKLPTQRLYPERFRFRYKKTPHSHYPPLGGFLGTVKCGVFLKAKFGAGYVGGFSC